jgi:hypothetical protein
VSVTQSPALIAAERAVAAELLRLGLPYASAMAATANATHESLCRPFNPSPDGSNGLWQWRDAAGVHRLTDLMNWSAQNGLNWMTVSAQCQFFLYEVKNKFPTLWADLSAGTKSIATLTANIEEFFERPASLGDLDARIATAQWLSDNLTDLIGTGPVEPVKPAPAPAPVPTPAPPVVSATLEALQADADAKRKAAHDALKAAGDAMAAYHQAVEAMDAAKEAQLATEITELG